MAIEKLKVMPETASMTRDQFDEKLNEVEEHLEKARKILTDAAFKKYVADNSKSGTKMLENVRRNVSEAENDFEELVEIVAEGS